MGENHAPNTNPKIAKSQANCRILIESKYNTQATEINYKTAYETATELSTQSYIGLMYANGQGVPEDDAEAMKWLRPAADQGDSYAQALMGVIYQNGSGVPQSDPEALKLYYPVWPKN